MHTASDSLEQRLDSLRQHLDQENPLLVEAIDGFRQLDKVGWKTAVLPPDQSTAMRLAWWPLVSVLGTFSAGKSSFINRWLGLKLQKTGNQAVDDRFTVICYGPDPEPRVLPGLALDADMRFPFYRTSDQIARLAEGDAQPVDAFLQLKTVNSERLRGRILVDSPGFDADEQRSATLRLTEHIMDVSDLVLVFFDARHPEPGAMKDTLEHLVGRTLDRSDGSKFLFILNQVDTAAADDNLEEVVSAWQRALAQAGLGAARTLTLYNPDLAPPIADERVRERFERRNVENLHLIDERINNIDKDRAYRIVGTLQHEARKLSQETLPALSSLRQSWARRSWKIDAVVSGGVVAAVLAGSIMSGTLGTVATFLASAVVAPMALWWFWGGLLLTVLCLHVLIRQGVARWMLKRLQADADQSHLVEAFRVNTRPWRSLLCRQPVGWNRRSQRRVAEVESLADQFTRRLNDQVASPSGAAPAST